MCGSFYVFGTDACVFRRQHRGMPSLPFSRRQTLVGAAVLLAALVLGGKLVLGAGAPPEPILPGGGAPPLSVAPARAGLRPPPPRPGGRASAPPPRAPAPRPG